MVQVNRVIEILRTTGEFWVAEMIDKGNVITCTQFFYPSSG